MDQLSYLVPYMFQKAQRQQRQELHVISDAQRGAGTSSRRSHRVLVGGEDIDHLVDQCITSVFELRGNRPFDGFVGKQGCDGRLVRRSIDLRDVGRGGSRGRDDSNAAFPYKKRSQDAITDKQNGVDAPSEVVCRTAVWKTTKGLVMFSSI